MKSKWIPRFTAHVQHLFLNHLQLFCLGTFFRDTAIHNFLEHCIITSFTVSVNWFHIIFTWKQTFQRRSVIAWQLRNSLEKKWKLHLGQFTRYYKKIRWFHGSLVKRVERNCDANFFLSNRFTVKFFSITSIWRKIGYAKNQSSKFHNLNVIVV